MDQPSEFSTIGFKNFSTKEGRYYLNESEFVTMRLLVNNKDKKTQVLRVENHTEKILCFGTKFSLEYFNENRWESVSLYDEIWLTIGYISANKSDDERNHKFVNPLIDDKISLYPLIKKYNKNKKGLYRLSKDFSIIDDIPGDWIDFFILSTEFEIR